jgi:ubiquinone/menaquinone biosynthesis C-methylase UbiE
MGSARQEDLDERYTHGHHESVLRSHRWRTVENSSAYLARVLSPGDLVLDLGCGPGNLTTDLAKETGATVIGLDNAPAAISASQRDFGGIERVSFCVGDGYRLPFADNTFAATHAHQVLQHSTMPLALLSELYRVTRPGGALGVRDATYSAFNWSPENPGLDRWLSLYLDLARENQGEPDAGNHLASWVEAAHFRSLEVTTTTWTYDDAETCAWWGGMWADRILSSNFGVQLEELGWTTQSELEELAQAFRDWSCQPGAWFNVPSTEVLGYK